MSDEDDYQQYDDRLNYKSISCENIPELFLDKLVAKKHFSKFGKINRFILRPKRLSCTVEYETEDDAERAYLEGANFNGHKFSINFSEREVGHVQNTEEWVDPDVQAELDAMGGGVSRMAQPPAPIALRNNPSIASPPAKRTLKPVALFPAPKPPAPAKATTESIPKVDASVRNELEALLRRPAYTDEDKYRVLDARDKLIRLTTVRQTDIKKAVSIKGICPDMCPEKERLMREFQRQVSNFEMAAEDENNLGSTISHRRAIKEYSRSSADQEVPLPHELRPEGVLQMTMQYLMQRIMDLCDDPQVSIADWFHFVWDRTRSIRKDITQQELCSLGGVQLVEQCARFHIHCAARLVAEDPSVFDKKINAENLTKCLQTLKYMYHDLRVKNVLCPCEAEFRSYIVLLNMGDANFLWELKQLPEHIQKSREIKQAVAFYNALQNNNYVRFFDMVRSHETSYLSACILVGYFNKLRVRAMDVISKSHNWRKNNVFLPLRHLTKLLGFENVQATSHFLTYHGLQCDGERVLLERLKKPDMEYSMDRALMLVESKRTVSVGECICGQTLAAADIFENHEPHSSFDANGMLKPEAWTADDQLRGEAAMLKAAERKAQLQQQQSRPPPTLQIPPSKPSFSKPTDTNIFKVPQASPPMSVKQQQQQQKPTMSSSIFGGKQFGVDAKASTNFKFVNDNIVNSKSNNTNTTANNIFKLAAESFPNSGKTLPTKTNIFGSIFAQKSTEPIVPTGGNIFASAMADTTTSSNSSNIFAAAAKATTNIFQQQQQQQFIQPQPMRNDNVFQHFDGPTKTTTTTLPKAVFGLPIENQADQVVGNKPKMSYVNETTHAEQQKRAAAEQCMRELEEEQRRKEKQLEEARQKLKQLEEQQAARLKAEAERKQKLHRIQANAEQLTSSELNTLLSQLITQIANEELSLYQQFAKRCDELAHNILQEELTQLVAQLAEEEYAHMCHDQLLLQRYFQRWKQQIRKRALQRQLMEYTPTWAATDTCAQQATQLLHPSQQENLKLIKRYRHGQACDFRLLLWNSPHSLPVHPLNLCKELSNCWQRQAATGDNKDDATHGHTRHYYKLLLTLPGEHDELPGLESQCNRWLRKYVHQVPQQEKQTDGAYMCSLAHDVALCVRKISGVRPLNERGQPVRQECDNADAVVCFMSSHNLTLTRKRLHHLLKLSKCYKCVPLALIIYDADDRPTSTLAECLQLDELRAHGIVCEYRFFGCQQQRSRFRFDVHLRHALNFLAEQSKSCREDARNLQMQTLQSWLEAQLGEELWQRLNDSAAQNALFAKVCSLPQQVVDVYNEAIELLLQLLPEDWEEWPEIAVELRQFVPPLREDMLPGLEYFPADWKAEHRQRAILDLLGHLKLPTVQPNELPANATDVEQWELWLLQYTGSCLPGIADDDKVALQTSYAAIQALIEELNRADLQTLEVGARFELVSWLSVIKQLAYARVNVVLAQRRAQLPHEVIYRRDVMQQYRQQPFWLNCKAMRLLTVDYSLDDTANGINGDSNDGASAEPDMETIIANAEAIARKSETELSAVKRPSLSLRASESKRALDESLYQFELAKLFGEYDVVLVNDTDDDEENEPQTQNETESFVRHDTPPHKRKRLSYESTNESRASPNPVSEVEDAIAKANKLIKRMEMQEDEQLRFQQKTKLQIHKVNS